MDYGILWLICESSVILCQSLDILKQLGTLQLCSDALAQHHYSISSPTPHIPSSGLGPSCRPNCASRSERQETQHHVGRDIGSRSLSSVCYMPNPKGGCCVSQTLITSLRTGRLLEFCGSDWSSDCKGSSHMKTLDFPFQDSDVLVLSDF